MVRDSDKIFVLALHTIKHDFPRALYAYLMTPVLFGPLTSIVDLNITLRAACWKANDIGTVRSLIRAGAYVNGVCMVRAFERSQTKGLLAVDLFNFSLLDIALLREDEPTQLVNELMDADV